MSSKHINYFSGFLFAISHFVCQAAIAQDNPAANLMDNENIHCVHPVAKKDRTTADELWCGIEDGSSHPSIWFSVDGKTSLQFMPWLSEGQGIVGVTVSDSGKYLAVIHTGEGHPYLVIYDIEKARNAQDEMHAYFFNPYPGSVGLYRWDNDTLLIETDYPVGKESAMDEELNEKYIIYSVDIEGEKLKAVERRTIGQ